MPKKSDMAERYAAAHARRDQRRRQGMAREYLPLADDQATPITGAPHAVESGRGSIAAPALRLPSVDYGYLRGDLLRTAALAIILFAVMIILALVLHV